MSSNWVTQYSPQASRQSRFDEPEHRWVELQENLNRWGGSHTWQQLQQLGQIARTNYRTGSYLFLDHAVNVGPQVVRRQCEYK